jgi:protein TonB
MVGEGRADSIPSRWFGRSVSASLLLHALLLCLLLTHLHRSKPQELWLGRVVHIDLGLPAPAAANPPALLQPRPRLHVAPPPQTQPPAPDGSLVRAAPPSPQAPAAPALPSAQPSPLSNTLSSADQEAPIPWAMLIEMSRMVMIQVSRKYPAEARRNRAQGTTVVHAHLARDGKVLDASVLKSSGFPLLDAAARELIANMHSFPALPDQYLPGRSEFYVDQPVVFKL